MFKLVKWAFELGRRVEREFYRREVIQQVGSHKPERSDWDYKHLEEIGSRKEADARFDSDVRNWERTQNLIYNALYPTEPMQRIEVPQKLRDWMGE